MTAESLPLTSCAPAPTTLSGWELEAWYEDLHDVLLSDVKGSQPVGKQNEVKVWDPLDGSLLWHSEPLPTCCPADLNTEPCQSLGLEDDFSDSLLEFLIQDPEPSFCATVGIPESDEQLPVVPESDSGSINHTEDEDSASSACGAKRKRGGQPRGGKRLKEKEQEGDRKVSELLENERLKVEIERRSAEVEKTRKALIDRMVNLKKE
ncbi:hypothetical protein NDU88_001934 [Pleurodeles waltl]|uniref:DNA damage-inducible transcript 3 protein n=1 Tax=Pleurodeles waltl TaxID=8319 RepID=A0AAV7T0W8_PLEWA|nr:hypothetical protein NDU88_001934 [Pleurodeles waltl]